MKKLKGKPFTPNKERVDEIRKQREDILKNHKVIRK